MTEVIGIKFKPEGRVYFFDPEHIKYKAEDMVIVETARGIECGTVASGNHFVDDASIIKPLKKVIRMATEVDRQRARENR